MSRAFAPPEEPAGIEEGPPEIHLYHYWVLLVKNRRLILLCLGVALAAALLLSALSRPSYLGSVVLAIEKDQSSPLDPNWKPQLYGGYDPEFLPTQTRLIRSREVAERVARRLRLAENPEYGAGSPGASGPAGDAAVARIAGEIRRNLTVEPVKGTNLLELSYVGPTAKLAAEVTNAAADAYIQWNLEARLQIVSQASEFLKTQIEQLRKDLDVRQQQLLAYGKQKDIISGDPQTNVGVQNLESLNRDYAAAVADRVAKAARYQELQSARRDAVADRLGGSLVPQLRAEQARLERDYAEKLNLFKPEWPAMQQLKGQIDRGKQHLEAIIRDTVAKAVEGAKTDYETALRREENLKTLLKSQRSEVMVSNSNAVEYNNLRVEVETKRTLLDSLLKRLAETEMISAMTGDRASNIRIVDRALPPRSPFRPSYSKNALIGILLGGGFGVGLAFILDYLDRSLRSAEDVENHLQLPSLGVIPAARAAPGRRYSSYRRKFYAMRGQKPPEAAPVEIELLPHLHPRSLIAERYRAFRASLLLSQAGGVKSIVITSCFTLEGKTATAVNLAVVLGQLGKRVLLVDADLHRPRLHEVLNVSNRTGLVSMLAEDLKPELVIQKTSLPDVFVVPSGPASPNPSGLLSSKAMSDFLELAKLNFDYLVLDAPPLVPLADALLVGHEADGVVLCVKGGETPREQVARVRDKLLRSNIRILGVLINNLAEDKSEYGARYEYGEEDGGRSEAGEEPEAAPAARTV